ncbi:MAG: LON peptidase substrate-binding domain-containing protein, partial [Treponema sp.]|nr:LON peptidase substrate-binding domain-containing protein [Treponema sp.]
MKNGGGSKKTGFPSFFTGVKKIESGEKLTSEEFALFPLRELVLYPNTVVPIFISYQPGMAALEEALRRDNRMFAACIKKKDRSRQDSDETWLFGTVVRVIQHMKLPDGTFRVVLQGEYR